MALKTEKNPYGRDPGRPFKGYSDRSWPVCPNCNGYGSITTELAIAIAQAIDPVTKHSLWPGPGGFKGDECLLCNGVGRVPDPSWPKCSCPSVSDACRVCAGLGAFSPELQEKLGGILKQLEEHHELAKGNLAEVQQALGVKA